MTSKDTNLKSDQIARQLDRHVKSDVMSFCFSRHLQNALHVGWLTLQTNQHKRQDNLDSQQLSCG